MPTATIHSRNRSSAIGNRLRYTCRMNIPTPSAEREAFKQRLNDAILQIGMKCSATAIAREYNICNPTQPITTYAARKWLFGESMPTQDRLLVLSEILGVAPHWLRFGNNSGRGDGQDTRSPLSPDIAMMVADVQRLDLPSRHLVEALVGTMLRQQAG